MKEKGIHPALGILIGIIIGIGISFLYINLTHSNKHPDKVSSPFKQTDGEDVRIHEVVEKEDNLGTLLSTEDILDWRAVLTGLKTHGTPDKQRVWEFLDEKTQKDIEKWNPTEDLSVSFKKSIVNGLNKIIERKDFYDKKAFADIKIGKESMDLINKGIDNLEKKQILRLNRLLFEAIYSVEIVRSNTMEFVYYAIAKQLSQKKDYKGALRFINKALEMNPESVLYLGERSQIYGVMADDDKMEENLIKFLEVKPDDIKAIGNLGRLYTDSDRSQEAIKLLTKRINKLPKLKKKQPSDQREGLFLSRAGAYWKMHEYDKAFNDLNKGLEIDPDNIRVLTERASIYESLGKMDKAKIDARHIVENLPPPKTAVEYKGHGVAHRILGNYDKAIRLIEEAMEINPNETRFILERALVYIDKNDKEAARRDLEKLIRENTPDKAEAQELLKKLESK
ncbi:MAG: tetratricopeptide repeat protein [Candidatus Eremiobacteraeota bacterium]|nr:tetratricopeptide repeat protein [Candidatus Eremiobacteraeota bacterium]